MNKGKRKSIEQKIYDYMDMLDPKGLNRGIYERLFKEMDDNEFSDWVSRLGSDYQLAFTAPNGGDVDVSLDRLRKIAKKMGIEVFEKLVVEESGIKTLTPHPFNLLRLVIRRANQHATSKINLPKNNKVRNVLTGQVTNKSKAAGITMPEALIISAYGLDDSLKELTSVRGGDTKAMKKMDSLAMETGKISLEDLKPYMTKSRGFKSLKEFYRGMHLLLK